MALVSPGSIFGRYWLPPLAWMAVVMVLSSGEFSATETGGVLLPIFAWLLPGVAPATLEALHAAVRKLAHLTEYGVLAALWLRALRARTGWSASRAAAVAVGISVLWAVVDEVHQTTVVSRTGSPLDVLLDGAGACIAVALLTVVRLRA
jgi:VanZ family protein